MNRRKFISDSVKAAGLVSSIGILNTSCATRTFSASKRLTILHTNDMHSRIEPFSTNDTKYPGLGGMARRATLINKIRHEEEHVLLLDSGDIWQGTPYFNYFGGELEFKLMSAMGYDAVTIGNHDFDAGIDGLVKMLPHAKFPFVVSNYDFSRNALHKRTVSYQIIKKGEIKIGVFGLGIDPYGLVPEHLYRGTIYIDPVAKAKEMVQTLNDQNCQIIICLSHLGYRYKNDKISDIKLAEKVSGIDIILGGHTHTLLDKGISVQNDQGHTTIINQVGWAGIALGRIQVDFNKNKEISVQNHLPIQSV